MKQLNVIIILSLIYFVFSNQNLYTQEIENLKLKKISESIQSYKDKEIRIVLRLKNFDKVFEKITFYDEDNHDIEFDVKDYKKNKKLKHILLNCTNGVQYVVKFIVKEKTNNDMISGKLLTFSPYFLEKLP